MQLTKKYPWILVALLWGVALLNYMDRQMLSTMRPSMQGDIAELQSATNFGWLMAVFLWVYGLMSPISGIIADRINRKRLILGSLFVWSSVTIGMGYATNFNQLFVLRAIMGISEALYIPAGLSLIADYHHDKSRSLAVSIHMTGFYVGQAIGGFGATIAASFSWQITFQSFGLIGIFYSVVLMFFLREIPAKPKEVSKKFFGGLMDVLSNPSFWVILFYFAVSSLPGWAAKNWLPTLFAEKLNVPMSKAGPIATITIAAASFIGVMTGGLLSDRWVLKNIKGRVYTSAIGMSLTIPSLLMLGWGHSVPAVISSAILFGVGFGMFDGNCMPVVCQFVSPRSRATAYGLMNMTGVFSGALITNYLGRATDAGNLGTAFGMLSVVVLIAVLVQLYFLRPVQTVSEIQ